MDSVQLKRKIQRRLTKLRLQPIRVFCFHQVSDVFEPDTMWECDWTQTEAFKKKILELKKKYTFIPLSEAYKHIANDRFRFKHFAALTADDGWASVKNIIPWLADQQIPVTLFLNPLYMDGKHYQSRQTEKLLTQEEVVFLVNEYKPYITIASHGWTHGRCMEMTEAEFVENVQKAEDVLKELPGKTPFYAFTYGHFLLPQFKYLHKQFLVPVLVAGEKNYHATWIYRECIDGEVAPNN